MNGKFEDKLAQLAFGELSPEEATRFEQAVKNDPDALQALSLYKDMREGLRSLSDVPEDQFSKERLRDAILKQGLRPVPSHPISTRSWLWMPVVACGLGFGLMFTMNMRHKSNVQPNIVMGDEIPSLKVSAEPPIRVAEKAPDAKLNPFAGVRDFQAKEVALAEVNRHGDPDEVADNVKALNSSDFDEAYDPDLGNSPTNSVSAPGGAIVVKNSPSAPVTASAPILLIEQDKDEQTGALKATEVGSSSNVLVGG